MAIPTPHNRQKRNAPHDGGAFDVSANSAGSRQAAEAPSTIPSYESIRHTAMTLRLPKTKHPTQWRGVRCINALSKFAASDGSAFDDSILRIRHTAILKSVTALRRWTLLHRLRLRDKPTGQHQQQQPLVSE